MIFVSKDLPQFVPQDVCLSCDGCCQFAQANSSWCPKMAREEIDPQKEAGVVLLNGLGESDVIKTVEHQGQVRCVFFQVEGNTCHVYEDCPFECRLYPFLLVKRGDGVDVGVHLNCPYIQEKRQGEDFKGHVENLRQYFQQQAALDFVRRNQILHGNYSGYEQEVECLFELPL